MDECGGFVHWKNVGNGPREEEGKEQVLAPKQKKGKGGKGGPRTSAWKAIVLERGKKGPFLLLYFSISWETTVRPFVRPMETL